MSLISTKCMIPCSTFLSFHIACSSSSAGKGSSVGSPHDAKSRAILSASPLAAIPMSSDILAACTIPMATASPCESRPEPSAAPSRHVL